MKVDANERTTLYHNKLSIQFLCTIVVSLKSLSRLLSENVNRYENKLIYEF